MNFEMHINRCQIMDELPLEVVERKGRGHPDTICDLLAERISYDLGHYYLKTCGRVLHYNVDKALLVGGRSRPQFGGGEILEPAKLYLGDRAISNFNGKDLGLNNVVQNSIQSWLKENLRFLRIGKTLEWKSEIKPGSSVLNSVEEKNVANDTSVGVGYWPLSTLESLTIEIEELLNSPVYRTKYPELGEDTKIMSIRRGRSIEIILACAFVDQYVSGVDDYVEKKRRALETLRADLTEKYKNRFDLSLSLNALDDPSRGLDGLYLTVTGLSCEGGDSGQVGRGNRVSGLISFMRPQTMEAWAGKNFKTHVGKIYSFAAQGLAKALVENVDEISESTVTLVGKIGSPVHEPLYVLSDFKIKNGNESKIQEKVHATLKRAIASKDIFQPEALFHLSRKEISYGI
ncbi:MAG: methionine adenosyltransferase [Nitrosomonas ureae]